MIESSPTARRTECAQPITPVDHQVGERYALFARARVEKPRCAVCGYPVRSGKVNHKSPRCDRHEAVKLSKTDQGYIPREENSLLYLPGLRYERERRGLSRPELQKRCGVHADTQQSIESGKHTRLKTARKLALALELEVEALR